MFSGLMVIPKHKSSPDFNNVPLSILPGLPEKLSNIQKPAFDNWQFPFQCYLWLSCFTVSLLTLYFHSFPVDIISDVLLKYFFLKPNLTGKSALPRSFSFDLDQTNRSLVGQIICLIFKDKLLRLRFSSPSFTELTHREMAIYREQVMTWSVLCRWLPPPSTEAVSTHWAHWDTSDKCLKLEGRLVFPKRSCNILNRSAEKKQLLVLTYHLLQHFGCHPYQSTAGGFTLAVAVVISSQSLVCSGQACSNLGGFNWGSIEGGHILSWALIYITEKSSAFKIPWQYDTNSFTW